jgi:beta-phosphoglucomutase-like phosphatase (HAD superfamily)
VRERRPLRAKPSPALYLAALDRLNLSPTEAIAIEDSPNGIRAAKDAALFCLVTPHSVSAKLDLSAADARAESLEHLPLRSLIELAQAAR